MYHIADTSHFRAAIVSGGPLKTYFLLTNVRIINNSSVPSYSWCSQFDTICMLLYQLLKKPWKPWKGYAAQMTTIPKLHIDGWVKNRLLVKHENRYVCAPQTSEHSSLLGAEQHSNQCIEWLAKVADLRSSQKVSDQKKRQNEWARIQLSSSCMSSDAFEVSWNA